MKQKYVVLMKKLMLATMRGAMSMHRLTKEIGHANLEGF
jgi:hypothetical protein